MDVRTTSQTGQVGNLAHLRSRLHVVRSPTCGRHPDPCPGPCRAPWPASGPALGYPGLHTTCHCFYNIQLDVKQGRVTVDPKTHNTNPQHVPQLTDPITCRPNKWVQVTIYFFISDNVNVFNAVCRFILCTFGKSTIFILHLLFHQPAGNNSSNFLIFSLQKIHMLPVK